MGADQLVRLLPAYKEEDNSTVWKALDAVLLGLNKVVRYTICARGRGGANVSHTRYGMYRALVLLVVWYVTYFVAYVLL